VSQNPWDMEWDGAQSPQPTAPAAPPAQTAPAAQQSTTEPAPWDKEWDHGDAPAASDNPAPWDQNWDHAEAPKKEEPPEQEIVITGTRHPKPAKGEEANQTYTVKGFADEVQPDYKPRSGLTDADKAEYRQFFKDRNHPPSAALLQTWYQRKTGFPLANAQRIVEVFQKTGKYSTTEHIDIPTKHNSGVVAGVDHALNAVGFDYSPEIGAAVDSTINSAGNLVGLGDGKDFGTHWANETDMAHAQLQQDSQDHPYWSAGGEVVGGLATIPVTGAAGEAVGLSKLGRVGSNVVRGGVEGAAFGSGSNTENRFQGGVFGGLAGAGTAAAVEPLTTAAARSVRQTSADGSVVLDAAKELSDKQIKIQPHPAMVGGPVTNQLTRLSDNTIVGGAALARRTGKVEEASEQAFNRTVGRVANTSTRDLDSVGHAMVDTANPDSFINLPTRLKDGLTKIENEATRLSGGKTAQEVDEALQKLPQDAPARAGLLQAQKAFQRAEGARTHLQSMSSVVDSLTNGGNGVTVAQRLNSMVQRGGDVKRFASIIDNASKTEADGIRASISNSLGRDANGKWSTLEFFKNYHELSVKARSHLFTGQTKNDMANLAIIANALDKAQSVGGNGGAMRLSFKNIVRAIDGFTAFHTGGATAWGTAPSAFLLQSPMVAKLLVKMARTDIKGFTAFEAAQGFEHLATQMAGRKGADVVSAFAEYLKHRGDAPEKQPDSKLPEDPRGLKPNQFDHIQVNEPASNEETNDTAPEEQDQSTPSNDQTHLTVQYDENGNPIDENGDPIQ
jgi:hypothetical protein